MCPLNHWLSLQIWEQKQIVKCRGFNIRPLATTMMVFMARGIFCDINFPYAQFPMAPTKAPDI